MEYSPSQQTRISSFPAPENWLGLVRIKTALIKAEQPSLSPLGSGKHIPGQPSQNLSAPSPRWHPPSQTQFFIRIITKMKMTSLWSTSKVSSAGQLSSSNRNIHNLRHYIVLGQALDLLGWRQIYMPFHSQRLQYGQQQKWVERWSMRWEMGICIARGGIWLQCVWSASFK